MSQQLQARCCCPDIEPPPPPPPPTCPGCEPVYWWDPPNGGEYYTVIKATWSFTLKTTYRRFDGTTFIYQDFDITVTVDDDIFEYPSFVDPCNIEPVLRLGDFVGDQIFTPGSSGLGIRIFDVFEEPTCTHHVDVTIFVPSFVIEGDLQWSLAGPSNARFLWSRTDTNNCTTRPHEGQYEVIQVDIFGYASGPNGQCVDVEANCGGPIVGQACAFATPIVLEVRECQ